MEVNICCNARSTDLYTLWKSTWCCNARSNAGSQHGAVMLGVLICIHYGSQHGAVMLGVICIHYGSQHGAVMLWDMMQ